MPDQLLEKILEGLNHLSYRPAMYVRKVEIATIEAYLYGLRSGCGLAGLEITRDIYERAASNRGWKWRACEIIWHMEAKKLDEEAIIQELIAVEAEAYRLAFTTKEGD